MKMDVTKDEFIEIYLNNPNRIACKKLNICENTLWRFAKELGLTNKKRRGRPFSKLTFKED